MPQNAFLKKINDNKFTILALLLISLGILFRVILFFQNRNLIIDEANVVRNISERGFFELLKPLSYEQYAPPIFLWGLKLFSVFLGYSEPAMRLVALLCGIGSIFIFWSLLRKILSKNSLWLPLGLFCLAPILVIYATQVKQYVPDAFIAIALVFFALKIELFSTTKLRFALLWILIGSIAIWSSQPSVFILAAIGFYYFSQILLQKKWNFLIVLFPIAFVWLGQFGLYYELILKSQINSEYLQNYHRPYFLHPIPSNKAEWKHNWERLKEILHNSGGYFQPAFYSTILFILVGSISLMRKSISLFILLASPVLLTLLAAALHQFSLIERVIMFILPFTMILLGFGFAFFMKIPIRFVKIILLGWGIMMLYHYNLKRIFWEKFTYHEITEALDYAMIKEATGKDLYIDCASRDTYIYYTQIHPDKSKYARLQDAYLFGWQEENFEAVAEKIQTPNAYFIFTEGNEDLRKKHLAELKKHLHLVNHSANGYVYIFQKK